MFKLTENEIDTLVGDNDKKLKNILENTVLDAKKQENVFDANMCFSYEDAKQWALLGTGEIPDIVLNFRDATVDEINEGDFIKSDGQSETFMINKITNDKILFNTLEYSSSDFYDLEVEDNNNFFAGYNNLYCGHNSCNLSIPFYHYEIELFSQLGDAKGSYENRARHTDQTIIINKWFLEKALNKEDIYLFHMNEVGNEDPELDLYDALGYYERFDKLYNHYVEKVSSKHKKKINAWDLLSLIINERMITGRVYFVFADNFVNSSFKENLYMTNLCCLAGDTNIETDCGIKLLKDIKVGDVVLSYNEKNKEKEFKEVLYSGLTNPNAEVYEVEYNNKKVRCTGDHRFLTARGYIRADELLETDEIIE